MRVIALNKLQGVEWDMQCQNIAVCDDEQKALAITGRYIRKNLGVCGIEAQVDEFLSADQMTEQMEKKIYQACFLDIDMPQINGIDLAERIIRRYAGIMVVFVSGREEYVFQSFRVHPFSFVRKSHFQEDMTRVLKDLIRLQYEKERQQKRIWITDDSEYEHTFSLDAVCYLEAQEKYVNVVLNDREKLIRCSMKKLEKELEPLGLIRCHKSYIVNMGKVYAVKHDHLVLLNRQELPIRRGMVTELKQQLCSMMVE